MRPNPNKKGDQSSEDQLAYAMGSRYNSGIGRGAEWMQPFIGLAMAESIRGGEIAC